MTFNFEEHAKKTLKNCNNIFNVDNFIIIDKPDMQNEIDDIGIEVTRAIAPKKAEYESVMNNYFGKGKKFDDIKNDKILNSPKFNGTIINCGNGVIASHYGKGLQNTSNYIDDVMKAVEEKAKKSKGYKKFSKNGLYIYSGVYDDQINEIHKRLQQETYPFDFYIINNQSNLFVLSKEDIKKFTIELKQEKIINDMYLLIKK